MQSIFAHKRMNNLIGWQAMHSKGSHIQCLQQKQRAASERRGQKGKKGWREEKTCMMREKKSEGEDLRHATEQSTLSPSLLTTECIEDQMIGSVSMDPLI